VKERSSRPGEGNHGGRQPDLPRADPAVRCSTTRPVRWACTCSSTPSTRRRKEFSAPPAAAKRSRCRARPAVRCP